jgi:hypothetical protein
MPLLQAAGAGRRWAGQFVSLLESAAPLLRRMSALQLYTGSISSCDCNTVSQHLPALVGVSICLCWPPHFRDNRHILHAQQLRTCSGAILLLLVPQGCMDGDLT